MDTKELTEKAKSVIRTRKDGDCQVGDVGAALVTATGNVHVGVCIDAPSGMGFCAEHNAIGSMVTAGESRIAKIVAVVQHEGEFYIIPPCGRCREFIYRIDNANIDAEVVLAEDKVVPVKHLLPHYGWDVRKIA